MTEVQSPMSGAIDSSKQEVWAVNAEFDEKVGFTDFDLQKVDEQADLFEEPLIQL